MRKFLTVWIVLAAIVGASAVGFGGEAISMH
jgi:hypothetical protein